MGTTKRERQKEGRQARLEAEAAAQRAATSRRNLIRGAVLVAIIIAVVFVYSLLSDDDADTVTTESAQTDQGDGAEAAADEGSDSQPEDTAGADDTDADAAPGATTACPAPEGQERTIDFEGPMEDCLEDGATYTAVFETTEGTVTVELDAETTPNTTNNFVALARYGYYDDTDLFRTDPSIAIIQGGSPHTNGAGDPGPGYTIPDEGGEFRVNESGQYVGPFTYQPGQLVMARSPGPDASGAQFFFTVGQESALLDAQGTYLHFGDVVGGMSILEAILDLHQADDSDLGGAPSRTVTIESITIEQS
ncbi:MAG: peptidylprolyl isomerase [Actinomycetia bacterium]|nr:peptidylprolyl isomerase [Actinomycetes bacterium]MCP3913532.1 peptidylprolyl isomerase [Actinomycetes bacterium]MCP4086494.1 peptidylprolyl isomerase [Actinomycetes bacterium]